ncbi:MAG: hypothetical protein NC922_07910 [Candidatus Omnitrophica bacterium]|nr:hypothetical protein [Candidatus Omnitrophota bacterium]
MKKIFLLFLFLISFSFSQSQIFLQITRNLLEKAAVYLIFNVEKSEYFESFINTLSRDLTFSGYFKVKGFKIVENIERFEKEVVSQFIITGEKEKDFLNIKVKNGITKEVILENNFVIIKDSKKLAHIISDYIVEKLTGRPGIARSKILFTSTRTGKNQIYIVDYDGDNLIQLTNVDYLVNFPRYLRKNDILFVSYEDNWAKIAKMNIDTKKIETFIAKPGLNACVSVCQKREEIAIVLSQSGNPEIYIADFNGNIKKRLTDYSGIDSSPSFSPDGKYIAFVSDRNGKPQIYIMDRDGFGIRRISYISGYCTSPVFSPDGNYIAYIFSEGGKYSLAIYEMETKKTFKISNLNCEEISWAPDSRHIVYSKSENGQELKIIDIFTKEERVLISGNYRFSSPYWFSFVE